MVVPLAIATIPATYEDYRYVLELRLDDRAGAPHLAVLMKNPSTASAERLDPTIGKVRAWAQRHGFARICVVNLFALRATHPPALNAHSYTAVVGPENDHYIYEVAATADVIVAGWGNPNGLDPARYTRRIEEVRSLLAPYPLHIVGAPTRLGYPRHGLHWNHNAEIALWRGP